MKHYENLMNTMTAFLSALKEEHEKLIAESNAQAEEARSLIARVQATNKKHNELTDMVGEIAHTFHERKYAMENISSNILSAMADIDNGAIPECAVEKFNGYCDICGEELIEGEGWGFTDLGEGICKKCLTPPTDDEVKEDMAQMAQ